MAIRFRPLKRSKSWPAPWKFHSISFSMMARNPLSCPIFPKGRQQTISPGEQPEKKLVFWPASAACSVTLTTATESSCSTWPRKWQTADQCASKAPGPLFSGLLPLDCARGFRADVVDDTVYAGNFVHDTHRNPLEYFPRQTGPIGSHCVNGIHDA